MFLHRFLISYVGSRELNASRSIPDVYESRLGGSMTHRVVDNKLLAFLYSVQSMGFAGWPSIFFFFFFFAERLFLLVMYGWRVPDQGLMLMMLN